MDCVAEMTYKNYSGGIKVSTADKWFSKCIRLAKDNLCEHCGCEASDCAHIYGRRKIATRWDTDNALSLCRRCHRHFEENPLDMAIYLDSVYPGRKERLQVKLRGFMKNNADTQKMVSDHYRLEYHRMDKTGERDLQNF